MPKTKNSLELACAFSLFQIVLSAMKEDDQIFDFDYVKEFPIIGIHSNFVEVWIGNRMISWILIVSRKGSLRRFNGRSLCWRWLQYCCEKWLWQLWCNIQILAMGSIWLNAFSSNTFEPLNRFSENLKSVWCTKLFPGRFLLRQECHVHPLHLHGLHESRFDCLILSWTARCLLHLVSW